MFERAVPTGPDGSPACRGGRPERPPAATEPDRSCNLREGKAATLPSPVLPDGPASATTGSGSWRSCQAPTHMAERLQPNDGLSSPPPCRQPPARHRYGRPNCPLEPAVLSSMAQQTPRPQNGATDHSHPARAAPPSAEHTYDRRGRSVLPHKADTSVGTPYGQASSKTATATSALTDRDHSQLYRPCVTPSSLSSSASPATMPALGSAMRSANKSAKVVLVPCTSV